jgi:hypothetical protein
MAVKLVSHVIAYNCDWCGEAEEHNVGRQPIGWFHLHGPHNLDGDSIALLLCPVCGMRATHALHEARARSRA